MKNRSKVWLVISSLIILSLVLAACGTPTPQIIEREVIRTQIVTEEREVVVTQIVTEEREVQVVVTPAPVVIDRNGAWVDTIVVVEEPSADAAISRLSVGDLDVYAFGVANPAVFRNVEAAPGLDYARAYGNHDELTFNPVGPVFEGTGKLNPFSVAKIREAMNWLVDRNYIAGELYGGMAIPRWFPINNASNDYAQLADVAKGLERKYAYNKEQADQVISEEMEKLGATKVGGVWQYEGAPVEIIILIRTEDTRREIGDYVGNQLEDIGFTVVRDYKTAAEAGPIWLSGDPNDGRFHIYTGGWVTTAVPRDLGYTLGYFFTDFGRAEPLWQAYENDPEFYEIADKLYNNDFTSLEERRELMARGLELVMMEAQRFWVVDRSPIYPKRAEINVSSDLYGGVSGSWLWMNTIRRGEEVGGSVRVGLPSILTQPWNPLDGSNWIFDMMLVRATGEIAYKPDPFTGLYWPNIFERAEVTIQEGLPVGQTHDWVSLEFAPEIEVPGDAWVDWDATEQRFITASEAFTDTQTAFSKNIVYYPADMFDTITWHDGSPLSVGDFVMGMILTFDRGKPESPIYDASKAPALRSFLGSFKGVRILSESPLVIETYTDNYQLDAELNLNTWFPYYAQGQGSWHMLALGIFAEAEGLGGFSAAKAQTLNADRFSYVSGPTVEILNGQMAKLEEGTLPYEATLSEYISADELATRTANYKEFFRRRGHLWIGTGPFYLERAFPVEGTVILQRYAAYPFPAGQWDRFALPAIPEVEVDGPGRVTAGQAAAFDVFVTFQGEDYAQADVAQVNYLVYDATGALVHTGLAEAAGDGQWTVNLTSDVTRGLGSGSNLLEVVVVSNLVALPVSETMQFVTSQ